LVIVTVPTMCSSIAERAAAWSRARQIEEAGVLLVRPDGYVAWRCSQPVWDENEAVNLLQRAIARILQNESGDLTERSV
jgi:2,4-dichlorophenol 6-monooxygenase